MLDKLPKKKQRKELEGVISNFLRSGIVLGLGSWSNHARLEENTFEQDIVLYQVEECSHATPLQ